MDVTVAMVSLWEMNRSQPAVSKMPTIIRFLGFAPYKVPCTLGEWLKLVRRSLGYSRRQLAFLIGGDQRSIKEWETDYRRPTKKSVEKLKAVLY
jgi:DNA-binding transcriptional regulator YiaG